MGRGVFRRLVQNYGMLGVLVLLCGYFSWATLKEQQPVGADAAREVERQLEGAVISIVKHGADGEAFARVIAEGDGYTLVSSLEGDPRAVRSALEELIEGGVSIDAIAAPSDVAEWGLLRNLAAQFPELAATRVVIARPYMGSDFLKAGNLKNVLNQIVVIAITAVGMTLVIITAGIDLSVGSLIALSAVVTAWLIREMGGDEAGVGALVAASGGAVTMCGVVGLGTGLMVTRFRLPPFIATLGVMQIASGLAYIVAEGQSIYAIPESFTTLGRGSLLLVPIAVVLMLGIYVVGHIVMTTTVFGRHVYAVGGNKEAARLSGVPVNRVLILVYVLSGLAAGVGGVVLASQLKSGAPTYGVMYELYVIAAVVVGGTSLSGGEGRVFGTLIGALIIAVIQNGMNLTSVESYTQKIVLGAVILAAVLLDMLRRHGWKMILGAE